MDTTEKTDEPMEATKNSSDSPLSTTPTTMSSNDPIVNHLKNQPFYVMDTPSYDRMINKLKGGERFVKSFVGVCPHKSRNDCHCHFHLNFLNNDGDMVRVVDGVVKPVYSGNMFTSKIFFR